MRLVLFIAVALALCGSIYATPQVGDRLTLEDGSTVWTYGIQFPPEIQKRIDQWMDEPGNRAEVNSANWKGYLIHLSIRNQRLYVERLFITKTAPDPEKTTLAPMKRIFGTKPPVDAHWFTGDLVEYFGKEMGYTHIMSRMRLYRFRDGILTQVKEQRTPRDSSK